MTIGLSAYLRRLGPGVLLHWCEACCKGHAIDIHEKNDDGRLLGWDGDYETPTIAELIQQREGEMFCEYKLRGGFVTFTDRCTHNLAGKVRLLQPYPMP